MFNGKGNEASFVGGLSQSPACAKPLRRRQVLKFLPSPFNAKRYACLPRPRSGPGPVGRGFVTVTQTPGVFYSFEGDTPVMWIYYEINSYHMRKFSEFWIVF